ncbi:hypothetical protein [Thalassovita aquimarina]|uniref:Uncharacterized protein n=1 Tax=Thalassovita aquimarina TaxID=2785917 RepID=A0ABS5HSG5_9RHOB|nr:hypothetical protein [Thalassovita aquimarina]MBR9651900.1 hypothetical protein [Thalassovita aquimarina]
MDSEQQKAGEKRVRDILINPLLDLGLSRPRGFTKVADFDKVVEKVICPKLAYMTAINLEALMEQVAANPDGKSGDQIPIPNKILAAAADIQPPDDDGSPLIRAVFAGDLGRDAIAGNFAPELLRWLKRQRPRRWPKGHDVTGIKMDAEAALRRIADIERRRSDGKLVSEADEAWLLSRRKASADCLRISELVKRDGAA